MKSTCEHAARWEDSAQLHSELTAAPLGTPRPVLAFRIDTQQQEGQAHNGDHITWTSQSTSSHANDANQCQQRWQQHHRQRPDIITIHETKAGVVLLVRCRGFCVPLWAVFPPLQVVFSSACSVASLGRFPNHYLPGHLRLPEDALADYPFGKGSPSTW